MTDSHTGTQGEGACRNCGAPISPSHEYCGVCGQKRISGRITLQEVARDLLHALTRVDRSVLSLMSQLLARPGTVARDFVDGRRRRYFGPFSFFVVCVAAGAAAISLSGFPVVTTNQPNLIAAFLQAHSNLVYFNPVPLLAAACRIVFAPDRLHFAEHLVLVAYTEGMHVLWITLVIVPAWYLIAPTPELSQRLFYAILPIWPLYFAFACSQFVTNRRWLSAIKGIVAVAIATASLELLTAAITRVFVGWVTRMCVAPSTRADHCSTLPRTTLRAAAACRP